MLQNASIFIHFRPVLVVNGLFFSQLKRCRPSVYIVIIFCCVFSLLIQVKKILIFIYRPCLCWTVVLGLLFWPCFRQESLITIRVTLFHDSSCPVLLIPFRCATNHLYCLSSQRQKEDNGSFFVLALSALTPYLQQGKSSVLQARWPHRSNQRPAVGLCVCVTGIVEYDHRCSTNGEKPDSCGYKSTLLRRERRWLYRQGQWDGSTTL